MDETQTPEAIIRSVLYGTLNFPEQDIPETVTALSETLRTAGYSIARTDDHISRATLEKLAQKWVDHKDGPNGQWTNYDGYGCAADLRKHITKEQS